MAARDEPVEETAHYGNGQLKYTGHRIDGGLHGSWTWYRKDGSVMRTGTLERGRQVGTWRTFDRSGALIKETTFD
jgi:antitoxin component YwqK of YwqJK toxin-antitoxin module